jgi:hypothetical protein
MKVFLFIILLSFPLYAATQISINGPAGSGAFGTQVAILPNGNFVVTDPIYDLNGAVTDAGAVFLYRPDGTLISTLTGNCRNDNVGYGGVKVLPNGNFVVSSPNTDIASPNGNAQNVCGNGVSTLVLPDAGAATLVNGANGINGVVSVSNSLTSDAAGSRISNNPPTILPDGNYLVQSVGWNQERGAVCGQWF